jgi:mono/diheme cytochrome c family protein
LLLPLALMSGCTREGKFQAISMWNESRIKPMEESPIAGEGSSARLPAPGAIARGQLPDDDPIRTGRSGGKPVTVSPVPITRKLLERGQERFNVYCSPCHSRVGNGEGMIVKRGFPPPPDYAIRRLRDAPIGHFFDVMTNGYGVMYSYADRVQPTDRWAIAAYIRVLQNARHEVPVEKGQSLRERARENGIRDPARGMNLPEQPGQNAPSGPIPGDVPVPTGPRGETPIRDPATGTAGSHRN